MTTDLGILFKNDWAFSRCSSVHLVWFCPDNRYFDRTNGKLTGTCPSDRSEVISNEKSVLRKK